MNKQQAIVDNYPDTWVTIAESRGWDRLTHEQALRSGDIDLIGITHPTNWLTEQEVEDSIRE